MNEEPSPVPGLLAQAVNGLFFSRLVTFFGTLVLSLLHHVYYVYLWLSGLVAEIRDLGSKTGSVANEGDEIRRTMCMLKKLPSHLVLILGAESPSYPDIVKLITWCLPAGIGHISIYDHKDELDCWQLYDTFCNLAKQQLHRIKWGKSFDDEVKSLSKSRINGYLWSPAVTVHVLGSSDGPGLVAEAVSQLSADDDAVNSSDLSVADVDRFMKRRLSNVPDPDLAVICGSTFTFYGCCPWNMRITQMQLLKTHFNLRLARFFTLLLEYNNCHQRYGK